MSKNIIIQEGGIPKQMTVSKIKVNDVGGGTSLWVPEDATTLKTKNISENGTYPASSDDAYGYSQVTVNVSGGNGSATSSGTPTTSNGVDPGGIGSSVVGKDTSGVISGTPGGDGNEYAVGIDSSGNIVATKVPSAIEIGKAPDKTAYTEGETIDYSGIIVILKGGDGAMLSNQDYPNGRVPFSELIFPVDVAPAAQSPEIEGFTPITPYTLHLNWRYPFPYVYGGGIVEQDDRSYGSAYWWKFSVPNGYMFRDESYGGFAVVTDDPTRITIVDSGQSNPTFNIVISQYSAVINGNTYYVNKMINYIVGPAGLPLPIFGQDFHLNNSYVDSDLINLFYNNSSISGGTAQIPVQWESRYDGRTFEDTFEITVTGNNSGSGSTDGGGYSDDSGGSSSGGGGGF